MGLNKPVQQEGAAEEQEAADDEADGARPIKPQWCFSQFWPDSLAAVANRSRQDTKLML